MEIENVRRELNAIFSRNSVLRSLLTNSHIILLIAVCCCLLSNIGALYWVSFGNAMAVLSYLFLIFAFIAKKYKAIYLAIIGLIINSFITLIRVFTNIVRYQNLYNTPVLIGNIVVIIIFVFLFVNVLSFVKRTGDMDEMKQMFQQGIDRVGQQVNSGMENIKSSFQNAGTNMNNNFQGNGVSDMNVGGYSIAYKPISPLGYIGYSILFAIPLIGFIVLLVFAFGGTQNVNLKNYARSYFCMLIIAVVLAIIVIMALGGTAAFMGSRNYW